MAQPRDTKAGMGAMMANETSLGSDDGGLDLLFSQAKDTHQPPSAELFARVLADAEALQPRFAGLGPTKDTARPVRRGFLGTLAGMFGGGQVLAGMGSAAVAGLVLGLAQPAPVSALTAMLEVGVAETAASDMTLGMDALIAEE